MKHLKSILSWARGYNSKASGVDHGQNTGLDRNIVVQGRHSYGIHYIRTHAFGEGRKLYIGSFNSIADGQNIFLGGNHRTDWSSTFPFGAFLNVFPAGLDSRSQHPVSKGDVFIENDVWIGASCTVMSGVRIGSGSVLAAGCLVTKDVPPYCIVGGNPARIIRQRFDDSIVAELLELSWWDLEDERINIIVPLLLQPPTKAILAEMRRLVRP